MKTKITISKESGYCMGVRRAFNNINKIKKNNNNTCIYGEMVHNKFALQSLYDNNVIIKEDIDDIVKDNNINNIIIRAHGISPIEENFLRSSNKIIYDFTCPKVKNVQLLAEKLSKNGFDIIIFGKKNHPEVIGIKGYCKSNHFIVKNINEAKKLPINKILNPAVISQTTMNSFEFDEVCEYLKSKFKSIKIENTLCSSPIKIQESAIQLAKKTDLMLVVGDKSSANTTALYEKLKKIKKSYFIETVNDLKIKELRKVNHIGITGGSSTPQWQMEKIKNYIENKLTK